MRDDQRGPSEKAGSQDRKTRIDSEGTVHHTVGGSILHGDRNEAPRGLTVEQANDQRSGTKLDERQTRENTISAEGKQGTDDVSAPFGGKEKTRDRS
jgi:hypothetical protein